MVGIRIQWRLTLENGDVRTRNMTINAADNSSIIETISYATQFVESDQWFSVSGGRYHVRSAEPLEISVVEGGFDRPSLDLSGV